MRLIDKGEALKCSAMDTEIYNAINMLPTVEAVKRGKWIDEGYYADHTPVKAWHCSECNWHMLGYEDELFRYCPMCGTRMDKNEIG